jgi:hypothetical protein
MKNKSQTSNSVFTFEKSDDILRILQESIRKMSRGNSVGIVPRGTALSVLLLLLLLRW